MVQLILGIIGSVIGIICSFMAMFIGGVGKAFNASGAGSIVGLGWGAFFFSILALVASILVKNKPKLGGWLMIISGIGGLICISMFYLLPAALIVIPGITALFRKNKTAGISA